MKYSVNEISLLIDLMLVKAQLPKEYSGLRELSERIEEEQELEDRTKKKNEYLYNIHNEKISNALVKQKNEISLSKDYLNEYLTFLNYEDYESYKEQYIKVKSSLEKLDITNHNTQFFLPRSKQNQLKAAIDSSVYPGQDFKHSMFVYEDSREIDIQSYNRLKDRIPVCFLPSEQILNNNLSKVIELYNENQLILVWLVNRLSELNSLKESIKLDCQLVHNDNADDLSFLIQLICSVELWHSKGKSNQKEKEEQFQQTNIKNKVAHNQGFVIGQLHSEQAPTIVNHFYGSQKPKDED